MSAVPGWIEQVMIIILLTMAIIMVILHSIGFYLLRNVKRGKFNVNNVLITCLSGVEILYGINLVLTFIHTHIWQIHYALLTTETVVWGPMLHSTIILITFNRYMACVHSVFYRKYATKNMLCITVVSTWMFFIAQSVGVFKYHEKDSRILFFSGTLYFGIFFVFIFYAYSRIYLKLAKSSQRVARHLPGQHNLKLPSILWNCIVHEGHLTSMAIILCYLLFHIAPIAVAAVLINDSSSGFTIKHSSDLRIAWLITTPDYMNGILDAIIYIYTDKDVKKLYLKKVNNIKQLCCSCRRVNNVDPVESRFTPAVIMNRSVRT